jgi:hypothetical protein
MLYTLYYKQFVCFSYDIIIPLSACISVCCPCLQFALINLKEISYLEENIMQLKTNSPLYLFHYYN